MATDVVSIARELLTALGAGTKDDSRTNALIETLGPALRDATPAETRTVLATVAAGVNSLPPDRAGVAARIVGAMVEAGHPPQPARAAMLGALQTTMPVCASLAEAARGEIGEPPVDVDADDEVAVAEWRAEQHVQALNTLAATRPRALDAWQRLQAIWPGAIALLSVDPEARAEARELAPIAERFEDVHEAAGWLRAMLTVLDDEPYVAIEPATRRGIAGRMSGIVDNFQLNTLLMDEFPRREPRVSKDAVAVARGDGPQRIGEQITGAWNLYAYGALRPGGELPDPTDLAYADTWIWHESTPADIPVLDGHRVILLGPASPERTWPAQRMFLKLRARLTADLLEGPALEEWLAKIEAAAAKITR